MNIINMYSAVLAIIIVLSLVYIFQKRKKQSHIPQLRRIALLMKKKQLKIRIKEVINSQFIGLDPVKKILLLSHLSENSEPVKIILLADIFLCRIEKESRDVIHRGRNRTTCEKELVRVSLLLYSFKKSVEAEFVFFDNELNDNRDMPRLLMKAEYWKNKIAATGNINLLSPVNN
jgi:hypothetical protein